ncbi:MAG: LysR family transcriptional regulator [Verrucomicrobiaceae bacterium]|nr:MAG: LysR family transcriptional regulator [Verrucomicrobiaceae bacterium]
MKMAVLSGDDPGGGGVDFRHLSAFQRVYQEKNYSHAGFGIFATRKSIVRMMQNLERTFACTLFTEGLRGELVPGPFAERLYNDLRFLNAARHRMKDHITAIHENGRVVHMGCSPAVFRTREFRNLFRGLQSLDGIRACYSAVESSEAGKALVSGHCDIYIGCWAGTASRFVTQDTGVVAFRRYQRGAPGEVCEEKVDCFLVSLDGKRPDHPAYNECSGEWRVMDEARWLYWLDHPEECPAGTVVFGPDVQIDTDYWQVGEDPGTDKCQPLHATFLRQHSYEFLPSLMTKILMRPPIE